jgi:hypothetical protein
VARILCLSVGVQALPTQTAAGTGTVPAPRFVADNLGEFNGSSQRAMKRIGGRAEVQRLSWSFVQLLCDAIKFGLRVV